MSALLKDIAKLLKKSAYRKETGRFVVEGPRMVREVPEDRLNALVFSENFERERPDETAELMAKLPAGGAVKTIPDAEFSKLSDTKTPQGVLAVVKMADQYEDRVFSDPDGFYIILEDLQDPGNLGTVFRTAEAAGASAVIMNGTTADIYNPKTVRATMGALFRMPFVITADLPGFIERFRTSGGRVYAAHLDGASDYASADYRGKCAFLIGNEGNGLSDVITALADEKIIIPMAGQVESLNAAVAASVLLFEASRQRRNLC